MFHDFNQYNQHIKWLAEWLSDPGNAEPCARFPAGPPDPGSSPGVYAWHGDASADALVDKALGSLPAKPLYLGRTCTPLNTRIVRTHLRNTKASTFRQSLAAMLWDELSLRCAGPKEIDAASEMRLTQWMLEHLSVTIVPIADKSNVARIEADVRECLELPLNLNRQPATPGTKRLRVLRRRHLSISDDLIDEYDQLFKIRAAEKSDPGVVVPITRASGKGSRRSRARSRTFWTPADAEGGA